MYEWTARELAAARRVLDGEPVGPRTRRTLAKLSRRIERDLERQELHAADVDKKIEAARRRGLVIPPGTAQPGGRASPPGPAWPPGGMGMPAGGAAPFRPLDARGESHVRVDSHLALINPELRWPVDAPRYLTARELRGEDPPSASEGMIRRRMAVIAAKRRAKREEAIAATAIDARTASPEEARDRLAALLGRGLDHDVVTSFRAGGRPLDPLKTDADAARRARNAAERAARRVRGMARNGEQIDGTRLPDDLVTARIRALGLSPPGEWAPAASRTPTR